MSKHLFFGYGANRSRQKMQQVVGKDPGEGVGAILDGYTLNLQTINQIPQPAKSICEDIFGINFGAYTIRKGKGFVGGALWMLSEEDIEKVREWEFVGTWREMIEVTVKSEDAYTVKVITEKSLDKFPVSERQDGLLYREFQFVRLNQNNPDDKYYTDKQLEKIRSLLAQEQKRK